MQKLKKPKSEKWRIECLVRTEGDMGSISAKVYQLPVIILTSLMYSMVVIANNTILYT